MRFSGVLLLVLVTISFATTTQAQAPAREPVGNLAQVMRAILFPNSNILFDTQSNDPDAPPEAAGDGGASSRFASIYTGWPLVETAAIALAESAQLIAMEGRLCQNGKPVPLGDEAFMQYTRDLVDVGRRAYAVAQTKDLEAMSEMTNEVAGACENCHSAYRRYPEENRCTAP
ncbi:MAG: hypothetical protein VX427_04940 [Acidobacteriota bacterium]|nr:hypothetical protein [Acidobacteriota bacterium]